MKKHAFILLVFASFALQSQDYIDKITNQTCSCTTNLSDTITQEKMYLELGICMINASEPFKKQLKKDHQIDFDNIDKDAEALGKLIGFRMATLCPDALLRLSGKSKENGTIKKNQEFFSGRVTKIEKDFFVVFTVNDNAGKALKFYWLRNAESNIELINKYETLFDKDVKIRYNVIALFDPKINDYRNFNAIENIEQLSR